MFTGDQIRKKRKSLGLSAEQLANILAVNKDNIYKWEKGTKPNNAEDYLKIENWLVGKLENVPHENGNRDETQPTGTNGSQNFIQARREQKNMSRPFMVPLVPVKAQAGYAASYNNTDFLNQLEMYPILPGIDPRGAVWRFFEVQGDSMEPALFNSDLVLVSMVPPADWLDIKKGQVYVIVTADDVFVKLIYPKDKDTWILASSNKRHKQKEMAIADIKEVWRYRRHVTNKIQWPKD